MSDEQFRALMNLIMLSDPTPLPQPEDEAIQQLADEEAQKRGFLNWIEAYHRFLP